MRAANHRPDEAGSSDDRPWISYQTINGTLCLCDRRVVRQDDFGMFYLLDQPTGRRFRPDGSEITPAP